MIRKSGKIRAANSRIDQMTSLSFDFYILYTMIDGIYTLLVPTRPLQTPSKYCLKHPAPQDIHTSSLRLQEF